MSKLIKQKEYKVGDLLLRRNEFHLITEIEGERVHYKEVGRGWQSTTTFENLARENFVHLKVPQGLTPEEYVKQIEVDALKKMADDDFVYRSVEEESNGSTALVTSSGPERLQLSIDKNKEAMIEIQIVKAMIERRINAVQNIYHKFQKQIEKWAKVLGVFELYLGIGEDILQLRTGQSAPVEMPISIRQLVLFMDEEVGDPRNQGINFSDVERFDEWAMEHIDQLIPEEKCIVAFRPSRQQRWFYTRNGHAFFETDGNDRRCYLLIRNGENFYRIYTEFFLHETFIPTQGELQRMVELLDDENAWERDKDKVDETQLHYARNAMLVQGLIDRTDVFNFYERPDVLQGIGVNFIFDAESILPDGHLPYKQWKEEINSEIKRGSRILISENVAARQFGPRGHSDRFARNYYRDSTIPPLPHSGVYTVEKVEEEEYRFYKGGIRIGGDPTKTEYETRTRKWFWIKYNPGDTVYTDWYYEMHTRKNRLSFKVRLDDTFVFNYDLFTLEDIEFYLNHRLERRNYLDIIPLLYNLKDKRLAELEWEKGFVEMLKQDYEEEAIWKAIEWWKNKVIWKRPLIEDDAKAVRMIKSKLKRESK